jgi:AcrR family transcriptional regulator
MTSAGGLRERKKRKTRDAIQREAMRLFQEQGYEATTIDQIAAAVDISPSTFFNYFPAKEDVVTYDRYDPMLLASLAAGPPDEPLSVALRRVLRELSDVFDRDREMILARFRLGLEVPELRARVWEEMERAQQLLCAICAARSGRDPDDFELRVVAIALAVAAFEGAREWVKRDGSGNLVDFYERAADALQVDARLDALAAPITRRRGSGRKS